MEFFIVFAVIIVGVFLFTLAIRLVAYLLAAAAIGYLAVAVAVGYVIALVTGFPMKWTIGIAMAVSLGLGIRNMVE